ncbi:ribonuclease [candidate division KSB3 bacterium]|uniref:Ribonuclease n=1 Tax=candidate division KSB3 bacterium TaxID=2044937 RepID=A0A2G6KIS8_9BACT|nr:MAG: ribonuclease [candidate division KSB3 bacterium]
MPQKQRKIFVLDTNVILHDSSCIYNFQEHDVILPITVLEELDHFKKGNETINYHARAFIRDLDSLSEDKFFDTGVKIGPGHGNILIKLEQTFHDDLALNFSPQQADHHILNIAYHHAKEHPERQVILVTKDGNFRMKAKSVGLLAQDYTTDRVKDISMLYTGRRIEEHIPTECINKLYQEPYEVDSAELQLQEPLRAHEYMILRNERKSVLGTYDPFNDTVKRIDKFSAYGITPRNSEQTFALHALTNNDVQLVSLSGKAGTGKTLLALAAGLEQRKDFRQIFMARPIVPLSNKDLGFLPGDVHSKLDPYMQPLYDNLGVIQHQFPESGSQYRRIKEFLDNEKLVISPLAYIRGRSLVKVYFIVDEAQNLTPHEVKTIITRAGEGTKMIFTGDIFQIDHPYLDSQSNGLSYLIEKMQGQKLYAHITLEKGERSELAELASNLL